MVTLTLHACRTGLINGRKSGESRRLWKGRGWGREDGVRRRRRGLGRDVKGKRKGVCEGEGEGCVKGKRKGEGKRV